MVSESNIIFRGEHYLAYSHAPMEHACTIIGLSSRGVDETFETTRPADFNRKFLTDNPANWGIKANFISFIPSRNCWYLATEVLLAIAAINAVTARTRVITYGSSMGGYAAVNLAHALHADYFFAISPLCTIFDPFMSQIRDTRFAPERKVLPQLLDGIARGDQVRQAGLVVFDDKLVPDLKHAEVILANTRASAITVSFSGHPSGGLLNKVYPLKEILSAIVDQSIDIADIQQKVDDVIFDMPQVLAADLATFDRFLDLVEETPQDLPPEAWFSASVTLMNLAKVPGVTVEMIDTVANAVVLADCWAQWQPKYVQTVWRLCRAYEEVSAYGQAADFATAYLPDLERGDFLARKAIAAFIADAQEV